MVQEYSNFERAAGWASHTDFVLIVIAGLAGGLLARFLRLPLLVGYIAAGVLIGPNTAGPTVIPGSRRGASSRNRGRFCFSSHSAWNCPSGISSPFGALP